MGGRHVRAYLLLGATVDHPYNLTVKWHTPLDHSNLIAGCCRFIAVANACCWKGRSHSEGSRAWTHHDPNQSVPWLCEVIVVGCRCRTLEMQAVARNTALWTAALALVRIRLSITIGVRFPQQSLPSKSEACHCRRCTYKWASCSIFALVTFFFYWSKVLADHNLLLPLGFNLVN